MASPMRARAVWMLVWLTDSKRRSPEGEGETIEGLAENEKPPAACAGGGLDAAVQLNPVNQALFPARGLWMVIRMAGMHTAFCMIERQAALARGLCMILKQVDQSLAGPVKRWATITRRSSAMLAAWDGSFDGRDCARVAGLPDRMPH